MLELADGRVFERYSTPASRRRRPYRPGLELSRHHREPTCGRGAARRDPHPGAAQPDRDDVVVQSSICRRSCRRSTDAATELSGAKFGAFFYNVTNANGDAFMLYTLSGARREDFEGFGQPRATALFGPTFRGEAPIRCDDVLQDPRYGTMPPHRGMPRGHLPVRSYLAVPVVSRSGEVIGGLFFGHPVAGRVQ